MKRTLALEALRHCIMCSLVFLSSASVKGQPILSDPLLLPGNLSLAPSAGDQSTAQIARGDDGYLIVWTDTRTVFATLARTFAGGPFTEPGLGTMRDIYAALLDSEGNIVRSFPLATAGVDYDQHLPALAWNGQHWLVCWLSIQQDNRFLTEIVGVRVAPDGTVIDTTPIRIQSGMDLSVHPLWVASDGTNWLVAWFDYVSGTPTVLGRRVAPDGTLLDASPRTLSSGLITYSVRAAYTSGTYLVVISDNTTVRAIRLNANLAVLGTLTLSSAGSRPSVGSAPTGFYVAYHAASTGLRGVRITPTGQVQDGGGGILISNDATDEEWPTVCFDGTNWVVGYIVRALFPRTDTLSVRRVSQAGALLDSSGIVVAVSPTGIEPASCPRISGGGALLAWTTALYLLPVGNTGTVLRDLSVERFSISASGVPTPLGFADTSVPRQARPRIAPTANGGLIVYESQTGYGTRILAHRLNARGIPIDSEPLEVAPASPGQGWPVVAWNGATWLIVWQTPPFDAVGNYQIMGRRMASDGTFVDAEPVPLLQGLTPTVAALPNGVFLVSAAYRQSTQIQFIRAVRVASDGTPLDATPIQVGYGPQSVFESVPEAASFGSRWLVVWQANLTHDNPNSHAIGALVEPTGTVVSRFQINPSIIPVRFRTPKLCIRDANTALVAWSYTFLDSGLRNNNAIGGRLVLADGAFASAPFNFVSITATDRMFLPHPTWDGSRFWLVWLDHRADQYPSQQKGDISAMRLMADGAVIDSGGFAVAHTPIPEDFPTTAAIGRRVLIAYSQMQFAAPYLTPRVVLRSTPPPIAGDVDDNGCVDDSDLLAVLFAFGQTGDRPEDLNMDGVVDDADLLEVLFHFGTGC
jgi:hypothetical protein